ncbi:MAG: glycoside hydrolase family 3 N-terminal domain-containing protein [Arenibacterium sp.]
MSFGATILDAEGLRLTPSERDFFRDANPFGFILFARNIDTGDQLRALCADMRDAVGRSAPITIDQEGGRVQRLTPPLARQWLPALDHVARAGEHAERAMYLRFRLIAAELHALGIDSNCAPLGDLARADTHHFLRNRCYGDTVETVACIARAVAPGLLDGGVLPVVKHMPGHGRATLDTHFDLPAVTLDKTILMTSDFAVFRALNDLPMGMTAHLVFTEIDDRPATLSPRVMDMIRKDIGFDGLIMTDDISMKALNGSLGDLSAAAIRAGCDVVLGCNQDLATRIEIAEAAGEMTQEAEQRAIAALAARHMPEPFDAAAAEAELHEIMGGEPVG